MAKISFANLKLKVNDTVQTVKCGDTEIEVLQYLPIADKTDLISITVQQAMENGVIHPVRLEQYFYLNIMYLYTNFNFTDKQKEDPDKLYDMLESNGIIDAVTGAMNQDEISDLYEYLEDYIETLSKHESSAAYMIGKIINDLPLNAAAAAEIVDNFRPEKYQAVVDFAQAANGGRTLATVPDTQK